MKTILFDIETSPNLGYVWGKWEQDVIENVTDWYILSFAYKTEGENTVHAYGLKDFPTYKKDKEDDSALVRKLHEVLSSADVVVAHNGDEFDIKKANSRFIAHGLTPPTPFKTVDTKKVAKKYFRFDSNKLDELGKYLGIGRKLQTGGFELWKGCMEGNPKSWDTMIKYNKQDVLLLEKVYLRLRPWMTNYPIVTPFAGKCRNCSGGGFQNRGYRYTTNYKIKRLQCKECGAWNDGKRERYERTDKETIRN